MWSQGCGQQTLGVQSQLRAFAVRSGWQWASEKTQPGASWGQGEHQDGSEEGFTEQGAVGMVALRAT